MVVEHTFHEDLDPAAGTLFAEKARFDHPGIVEHQDVARGKKVRKSRKRVIRQRGVGEAEKTAGASRVRGTLRDEFAWKRVVEIFKP